MREEPLCADIENNAKALMSRLIRHGQAVPKSVLRTGIYTIRRLAIRWNGVNG